MTTETRRPIEDARLLAPGAIVMAPTERHGHNLMQRFVLTAWDEGRHMWNMVPEGTMEPWSVGAQAMVDQGWELGEHLGIA